MVRRKSSEKLQIYSLPAIAWAVWAREGVKPLIFRASPILPSLGQAGHRNSLILTGAPRGVQPLPFVQNTTHVLQVGEVPRRVSCPRLGKSGRRGKKAADIARKAGEVGC